MFATEPPATLLPTFILIGISRGCFAFSSLRRLLLLGFLVDLLVGLGWFALLLRAGVHFSFVADFCVAVAMSLVSLRTIPIFCCWQGNAQVTRCVESTTLESGSFLPLP